MIFSIGNHIQQIITGTKTHTRRPTDRYEIGKTYAIQPGRTKKGIPEGRIKIFDKWEEPEICVFKHHVAKVAITRTDAEAEGGYTIDEYETLYEKMYPGWKIRWAYKFKFVPKEGMQ